MAVATEVLIRLYESSKQGGVCRGCQAPIDWYETLAGKRMPMNGGAVPRRSENQIGIGVIAFFATADSHWSSCPAREQFARRKPVVGRT